MQSLSMVTIAPVRPPSWSVLTASPRATTTKRALRVVPRASISSEVFQLAEEVATKVGDVSAPEWVLPAGVVTVTVLSILSGYLLKPGADAADEIRKRDERSGRFRG